MPTPSLPSALWVSALCGWSGPSGPGQGLPLPQTRAQPWGRAGRSQAAALAAGKALILGGLAAGPCPPSLLAPVLGDPGASRGAAFENDHILWGLKQPKSLLSELEV